MYCAVHSPMPGSVRSVRIVSSRLRRGPKMSASSRTVRARAVSAAARARVRPRHERSRSASWSASGKTWVSPCPAAFAHDRRPERRDEAGRQPHRADHRDLLPEQGADGQLEAVPGAGHPQPGPGRHPRREIGILGQVRADQLRVRRQVEHAPEPRDDSRQRRELREPDRGSQGLAGSGLNRDGAVHAAHGDGARVGVARDGLDARDRAAGTSR